jgi:arylsulfatase A-like enzyme
MVACGKCSGETASPKPVPFPKSDKPAAPVPPAAAQPNVVIVTIDTLRADHLQPYGYAGATSKYISRLAKDGVVFEHAFAAHTNTAPSHASMLTGAYPGVHGIRQNGMKLAPSAATLAEMLRERGYATGAFVSGWTLTPHTGLDRGFDVYDAQFSRSRRPGEDSWKLADRWLKKTAAGTKPFFLFFHMFEPHFGYEPPDEYALRFLPGQSALQVPLDLHLPGLLSRRRLTPQAIKEYTARYDGEIALADHMLGKLLSRLKKLAVLENTLIIFTSDHGETLFERPWIADHGGRAYDEQTHVPMIVRLPNREKHGKRVAAQVHHVDIVPTVLDVIGETTVPRLPGRSLAGVARSRKQREDTTRAVFTHARPEPERVPEISAALVKTGLITAIRLPPFKLIEYPLADGQYFQQVFNVETDPGETRNVAREHPEVLATLRAQLDAFRKSTGTGDANAAAPQLTPEVHEQLKSLGYVQ